MTPVYLLRKAREKQIIKKVCAQRKKGYAVYAVYYEVYTFREK